MPAAGGLDGARGAADQELRALLAWARDNAGLTQEQLAGRAGVARNTVKNYEKGGQGRQTSYLNRVLDALDLAPQQRARALQLHRATQPAKLDPADAGSAARAGGRQPAIPGVLRTVASFRSWLGRTLPGIDADVVGPGIERAALEALLATGTTAGRAPVVLVVGPAGVGKTRLAIDVAHQHAPTVVAPASVPLRPEDLDQVPVDGPAVLVVDDAHLSPDLTGLPAMLGEERFDRVAVVLTARPGLEQAVLRSLGDARDQVHHLRVAPLGDLDIDEIVRGHGFTDEPFRRHVIQASRGIPLVAHMACATSTAKGQYRPRDTADILRLFVGHQLEFLDQSHDQGLDDLRRATAVAVAALAGAHRSDRDVLATLAPAIGSLPPEPDRLDRPLNDLLEAGLIDYPETPNYPVVPDELDFSEFETSETSETSEANSGSDQSGLIDGHREDGRSHVVRPDAAGPILLADALANTCRVRIDLAALLPLLGRHATFSVGEPAEPRKVTPTLAVPPPEPDAQGLDIDVRQLATQLGVLAQAVDLAQHRSGRALLRRAVAELTVAPMNVSAWVDVVTLIGQAAIAAPDLITDTRQALFAHWPPQLSPPWWSDEDPITWYKGQVGRLLTTTVDQLQPLEHHGPDMLMAWVLDTAWLAHPALRGGVREPILRAAKALSTTHSTRGVDTVEAALARRAALRNAINSWLELRVNGADDVLAESEHRVRRPETALLLACTALEPLLSVLTMEVAQVPGERFDFTWSHRTLADIPATATELDLTVQTVIELLDRLLLLVAGPVPDHRTGAAGAAVTGPSQETMEALRLIARRPFELVAEGARGIGADNAPLPEYTLTMLDAASDRLADAIAERWCRLPLMTRRAAAAAAVHRANTGRRSSHRDVTLKAVADRGDPIAARAIADDGLAPVLTLLPVDHDILGELAGRKTATIPLAQRRSDATALGTSLPTAEAIALLQLVSDVGDSAYNDFLPPFATAAGQATTDPQLLLDHLDEQRFRADSFMLGGSLSHHATRISTWLIDRLDLDHPDIVELALATIPDLPTDTARLVQQRVVDLVSTVPADDVANAVGDAPSEQAATADDATVQSLADKLARRLGRPGTPAGERLEHLRALGLRGPDSALGQVAMSIGHVLRENVLRESNDELVSARPIDGGKDDPARLRQGLVAVLRRSLNLDDARRSSVAGASLDEQYMIACGAIPLLTAAPSEMAELLVERARSHPDQPIPAAWQDDIVNQLDYGPLTEAADALQSAAARPDDGRHASSAPRLAVAKLLKLLRA